MKLWMIVYVEMCCLLLNECMAVNTKCSSCDHGAVESELRVVPR